ncbi:MAG: type IX secretion system membrane protein PorP/SprF [Flavobacteriales bacterium]|jgi:type IX secretion system PorP/SprF family membrane protein|nr:type IX secretion system membrane protein PorP/SprF [Flavobacteriales bacterium]
MKSLPRALFLMLAPAMVATAWAQQLPQLTQYQFNDYVFNPAVAGSRPLFEVRSGHRYQWTGIQDAPRTFTLSATTPVARNMGIGGYIFTDHVGPTRRTGMQLSYTYHLKITEDLKLGMALSGGMLQFLIDGSKIELRDPGDPAMDDQLRGELLPDAKFAIHLHHPRFWFGATAPQIMGNKVQFMEGRREALSRMEHHYYATAGYRFPIGEDFVLEPSVMVKYVDPVPPMIDATATVRYRGAFWLGASYRTNDAWCAMVGCWIKDTFQFGYSYDMLTSNLRNYSSGSHEVMLAITLAKPVPARAAAGTP